MLKDNFFLDLRSGYPSTEQLKLINKYRNIGGVEYTAEELYTFPTLASDNLLHHNNARWSLETLDSMGRTLVGKDFLFNHDWGDSKNIQGIIFDGAIVEISDLSLNTKLFLTEDSPNVENDLKILTKEGYHALILWVAVEANSPIASDIVYLRQSDLSVGGYANLDYICPECNVSFDSDECPHIIPDPTYMWLMDIESDDERLAPYYIRHGDFSGMELSMVVSGNCPRARILREIDLESMNLKRF
jgi:hypothetical protein